MIDCKKILKYATEILAIPSPSGYCNKINAYLKQHFEKLELDYDVQNNSGIVVNIKGSSDYTVGLSSHVDTLGAIVKSINANGTLKFAPIGGPILPTYDGEYCTVFTRPTKDNPEKQYTGTFLSNSPSIHVNRDAATMTRTPDTMNVRLDNVVKSRDDVIKLGINNGDYIALDPKTTITDSGYIKSRFLDDKISAAILLYLIDYIKEEKIVPVSNLKIIFTNYEEVGFGSSYIPDVDELIAVDMGCIGEDLQTTEQHVSICAKDNGGPYNYDVTNRLIDLAKQNSLNYAVDVYSFYSSDVSAALKAGNNIKGGLIGPGVHASHGMERTHIDGILNTFKLLLAYITTK